MKIALDVYGGDFAPLEPLKAADIALKENKELEIVLVGKEKEIKEIIKDFPRLQSSEIINAEEVITSEDSSILAVRRKKKSSIVYGLNQLNQRDDIDGFVSAGSSGALLTSAYFEIGLMEGISRPGFAALLPTQREIPLVFMDCGANPNCEPQNLYDFALLSSELMRCAFAVQSPRVAILSNGPEKNKGSTLTKEAYDLISQMQGITFKGNIEARDIITGDHDIIIADGFSGNVAIKSCEGMAKFVFDNLKSVIKNGGLRAKLGYLFLKPAFKELKNNFDYSRQGGAIFLGLNKIVTKVHGSAKAQSFVATINLAARVAKSEVITKINEKINTKTSKK